MHTYTHLHTNKNIHVRCISTADNSYGLRLIYRPLYIGQLELKLLEIQLDRRIDAKYRTPR